MPLTKQDALWMREVRANELQSVEEPRNQEEVTARATLAGSALRVGMELFGYGIASGIALVVDVAILKTLVDIANWHYLPASTVAFIAGAGVAYVLSVRYVFRGRRLVNRTAEFLSFVALGIAGLLVNAAVLSVGISALGLGLLTSKGIAAVCAFTTNFVLRRTLLFPS
jgi:putative flippase GtrA